MDTPQKPKMVNLDDFILLNNMTDEQLDIHHKAEMKRLKKKEFNAIWIKIKVSLDN